MFWKYLMGPDFPIDSETLGQLRKKWKNEWSALKTDNNNKTLQPLVNFFDWKNMVAANIAMMQCSSVWSEQRISLEV